MIWFILYLLSIGVAAVGFFGFNKHFKWVTKSSLERFDSEFIWAGMIFGIILWPIALIIIGFMKLLELIKEAFIPE